MSTARAQPPAPTQQSRRLRRTAAQAIGEPSGPLGALGTALAYLLVIVLMILCAIWGAFLVPLRIAGYVAPVSWLIAAVGNYVLGTAGGRLYGRLGAAVPGLVWLVIAFTLGTRRPEGDLVVVGTLPGLGFLLVGAVAAAAAVATVPARRPVPTARTASPGSRR